MGNPMPSFTLGTAVKITIMVSIENPTPVKIKITDPSSSIKVNEASMTQDAPTVFYYVYQSATTDLDGEYIATITASYGSYTTLKQEKFILEDIE